MGNVGNIDLSGNSVPTLGDLDADGDLDMLIGQLNGSLVYYKNIGSATQFNFQLAIACPKKLEPNKMIFRWVAILRRNW